MKSLPIEIREAYQSEHNFIYNSWIKSGFRSKAHQIIAKEIYTLNQHEIITHILARADIIVAQEINKPESIYAYLVYQYVDGTFVAHYAYTKEAFRNLGMLSSLLQQAGFNKNNSAGFLTHPTVAALAVGEKNNLFYNPYVLLNPKYEVLVSAPKVRVIPPQIDIEQFTIITQPPLIQGTIHERDNEPAHASTEAERAGERETASRHEEGSEET